APLIATALFAYYHSGYAIAIYVFVCGLLSLIAASRLGDHTNKDISQEYDEPQSMSSGDHGHRHA
ncbi:MAG: MFS transporter, partial [Paraburkholderia graminis]